MSYKGLKFLGFWPIT